jgi:hypothetical protein
MELSSKKVGAIVRNELGLYTQRRGPGYQLRLDQNNQQCVYRLAESYCVLSLLEPEPHTVATDASAASTEGCVNVHDMHDIHLLREFPATDNVNNVHHVHSPAAGEEQ